MSQTRYPSPANQAATRGCWRRLPYWISRLIPGIFLIFALDATIASWANAETPRPPLVITADTPWIVSADQPEPVRRALEDVQRDWYKVLGHVPIILQAPPVGWQGPLICLGLRVPEVMGHGLAFDGPESFQLLVRPLAGESTAVIATGPDIRGAIYAAYAFSEKVLGVDPWWYWADREPAYRARISLPADFGMRSGRPTFRYRGWFINDEDLLSKFRPDPLRENVYSLEALDRICETLLRLGGNMIVPGSFALADETSHEFAARRGLVLGMHHVQVVGLDTYRWPKGVPFSFATHPEIMERYWQTCIDAYEDKEVVWCVGYRGERDRPFWEWEPAFNTPKARGAVITAAMAKQVELVRRAQPDAAIVANLWNEGADLYRQGFIEIPTGVTLVWPDNGRGLIRDNGEVKAGEGIYYHVMMYSGTANHLTEMVPPARIYHEIERFVRADATEYFLLNVSNVRAVPLGAECAMNLVWNAAPFLARSDQENQRAFLLNWNCRQFGDEAGPAVADLWRRYYAILEARPGGLAGDNAMCTWMRRLGDVALPLIQLGRPLPEALMRDVADRRAFASGDRPAFAALLTEAKAVELRIPSDRREFYQANFLTPLGIQLHSDEMLGAYCRALQALAQGDRAGAVQWLEQTLVAVDAFFASTRKAEIGKWAGWYEGEGEVWADGCRDLIRSHLAVLRGEAPPPVRERRDMHRLFDYQDPFQGNFPLMYRAASHR